MPSERLKRLGLAKPLCLCPTAERPEVIQPFCCLCVWHQPPGRCEDRWLLFSAALGASAGAGFEASGAMVCAFRLGACARAAAQLVPYIGAVVPAGTP